MEPSGDLPYDNPFCKSFGIERLSKMVPAALLIKRVSSIESLKLQWKLTKGGISQFGKFW